MKKLFSTVLTGVLLTTSVAAAQAQTFSDVATTDWFYNDVEKLVLLEVIDGTQEAYRAADNVNRAEVAKMIITAFDIPLETPAFQTFSDVPKDQWYYQYVETMAMNGIAIGYIDENGNLTDTFGPQDPITREQAAKMIVLGASMAINTQCGAVFSDVFTSMWSSEFINTLYANSAIDGYEDGTFGPARNINRAEIARIINKSIAPALRSCAG